MNLSNYIAELLVKNNCVIVPNFGGFIANYQSAVIDEVRNKIYPPSKHVLFNPSLLSNDGLLADYVSRQIQKSYGETLAKIEVEVEVWKQKLAKSERISIGEVGFLFQNEKTISFEQNREFNLLLGAYGLSSVKFISAKPNAIAPKQDEVETKSAKVIEFKAPETNIEDNKEELKSQKQITTLVRPKSKRWKYVAVACLLPALFYSYWIPMNSTVLDTGNIQMADFNPLHQKAQKTYQTRLEKTELTPVETLTTWDELTQNINPNVKVYNYKFNDELYIPVKLNKIEVKKTETLEEINDTKETELVDSNHENQDVQETITVEKTDHHIHLIAGCFSSKANANNLVNDLKSKGYNAHIVDQNKGLFRVSAESFSSKSEAKSIKSKLASESISTWILNQ